MSFSGVNLGAFSGQNSNNISPRSSLSDIENPKTIGVKDIAILEVVRKSIQSINCECLLTFRDGIKVSCNLTLAELGDLFTQNAFKGVLRGISPLDKCMGFLYLKEPDSVCAYHQDSDDMRVAAFYNSAKEKSSGTKEPSKDNKEKVE